MSKDNLYSDVCPRRLDGWMEARRNVHTKRMKWCVWRRLDGTTECTAAAAAIGICCSYGYTSAFGSHMELREWVVIALCFQCINTVVLVANSTMTTIRVH